jgi:lipoprotein-anchoring transpeptidase ErfK/SrfK
VENNAASAFSSLRSERKKITGGGGGSSSRRGLFLVLTLGLYLVVAALIDLWPFSAQTPAAPDPSTGEAGASPTPSPSLPQKIEPAAKPAPQDPPKPASETRAPDAPSDPASALFTIADQDVAEARRSGDVEKLRFAIASRVWDERYPAATRAAWLEESRSLAKRVVFSATPMAKSTTVTVKDGDNYVGICAQLRKDRGVSVTPDFLQKVNDVAPEKLRAKMTLKVPTEPMSVVVDKSDFRVWLLLGGSHLLDYPCGLGREERTPEGSFTIQWKTKNPEWTDPRSGKVLRFGEPGHIIGTRWLGFAGQDGNRTGIGIHGTVDPASIGKNQSDGCVRMLTPHVEELYDLVPSGVPVLVRR